MSNSHPLHPFFMSFEPVAHPLQAVVLATVPLFFPTVSEAVHSDWRIYLLHGPERQPAICKSSSNLLLPVANAAIASTDVNDANCLVEDLWELQSDGESAGQGELSNAGDCRTTKQGEVKRSHSVRRQRRRGVR